MFRIDVGDRELRKHLESASLTFVSKTVQNGLINTSGLIITNKIINEIKNCGFFQLYVMKHQIWHILNKCV